MKIKEVISTNFKSNQQIHLILVIHQMAENAELKNVLFKQLAEMQN